MLIKQQNTFRSDLRTFFSRVDVETCKFALVSTLKSWYLLMELKSIVIKNADFQIWPVLHRAGRRWTLPTLIAFYRKKRREGSELH